MSRIAVAALGALACLAPAAHAHTTSTGLVALSVSGSTVQYRLTLVSSELPAAPARMLALAAEGDQASVERVGSELGRRVTVGAGDEPCRRAAPPSRARASPTRA